MAKILKFPIPEKKEEMNHELDMARELMNKVVLTLSEYRYDVNDPKMIDDLGVIYHMLYSMMLRNAGRPHQWHEMIDEIIKEMKRTR